MIQDRLTYQDASATAKALRVLVRDTDGNVHCGCGNVTTRPTKFTRAPFAPCSACNKSEAHAMAMNTTKGALCDEHGADLGSHYDVALPQEFANLAQETARRFIPTTEAFHAPFHFVWNYDQRAGIFGRPYALTGTGQWLLGIMDELEVYSLVPVPA